MEKHLLTRAFRLGSTAFLVLAGLAALGLAGVLWHHQTTAHQGSGANAEVVHTDVIFVFASSPSTLVAGAAAIWCLCVAISYLWLASRR